MPGNDEKTFLPGFGHRENMFNSTRLMALIKAAF
jgi:hypothetical protein